MIGAWVSFDNVCSNLSGAMVRFEAIVNTNCIRYEGMDAGTEKACYVLCDDVGLCDTTYLYITVLRSIEIPTAVIDVDTTNQEVPITMQVLNNDTVPLGLTSIDVTNGPGHGSAHFDVNGNLVYIPEDGYCDPFEPDRIEYTVCNVDGCSTATVFVYVLCREFHIYNGFSPNGDGKNDYFVIDGIEHFENNSLMIFNRWGNMVFSTDKYQNNWGGLWNGYQVPDGTYFYVLDTGDGEKITGYLQILR